MLNDGLKCSFVSKDLIIIGPVASYVALVQFTIGQFESPLLNMKVHHSAVDWRIGSAGSTKELYHSAVFTDTTNSASCHPHIY